MLVFVISSIAQLNHSQKHMFFFSNYYYVIILFNQIAGIFQILFYICMHHCQSVLNSVFTSQLLHNKELNIELIAFKG